MSAVLHAATSNVVLVGFDRVYGLIKCYPVNQSARTLAMIAGTKTLSPSVLQSARALGLTVAVARGGMDALEDFLAGRLS